MKKIVCLLLSASLLIPSTVVCTTENIKASQNNSSIETTNKESQEKSVLFKEDEKSIRK